MRKRYDNEKIFICLSFFIGMIVFILCVIYNYANYKNSSKEQEQFLNKKIFSDVITHSTAMEEKLTHVIDELEFIKKGFINGYINEEYKKEKIEKMFTEEMETEKGLITAYAVFKDGKRDITVSYDEKALYMVDEIFKESQRKSEEIYISDFRLDRSLQYYGIVMKVNERSKIVVIYNFKYIVDHFIENTGTGNYLRYFILDKYGNIVFNYEKDRIGKNIFAIYSENESLKKNLKKYFENERGIYIYPGKSQETELVKEINAWKSFELKDKKIIVCFTSSKEEIESIINRLKINMIHIDILLVIIFFSFMILLIYYKKDKNKIKEINNLKKEKERMESAINGSCSSVWEFYPKENKVYFSEKIYEITGYNPGSFDNTLEWIKKIIHKEDYQMIVEVFGNISIKEPFFSIVFRVKSSSGKYIWLLNRGRAIENDNKEIEKIIGVLSDVTILKQKEAELLVFKTAVEQSPVTILFTDIEGKITYVNQKFTTLTGYNKEEALGNNPRILKSEKYDSEFYRNMWDTILAGAVWTGEIVNRKKNGEIYNERANIAPITDENNKITGYLAIKEDITKQKEVEEKMVKFATRDELTGVLNRRAGIEFLEQQIKIAERNSERFAVIYVDVNNLKVVNDNLGHNYGDNLIVEVCGGIKEEIRSTDIVARLGGDEFMIVMPKCDKKESEIIWKRIERAYNYLNNNFAREYKISASHGIYEYIVGSNTSVDIILETADKEMYKEKNRIKAAESEGNDV